MNTKVIKISLLALVCSIIIPTSAEAYRFVESTSQKINENTYLLTHTFTLGFLNADMQAPMLAGTEPLSAYGTEQVQFLTPKDGPS